MSLPLKIMEQCRLYPAKSWSNAEFTPQNHGAMQTLPREITEPLFLPRKNTETSFFAPRNFEAMETLLHKIVET